MLYIRGRRSGQKESPTSEESTAYRALRYDHSDCPTVSNTRYSSVLLAILQRRAGYIMTGRTGFVDLSLNDLGDSTKWRELYPSLRSFAKHLIYSFKVSTWYGQEEDMIEDVVQEAVTRILERSRRAKCGETTPIHSLEHIIWTVIRNYCIDMRRRDCRLVHTPISEYSYERCSTLDSHMNMTELATEHVYEEELFTLLAHEIVKLPDKQRTALLIDLANRMQFDTQPTPLQNAFLALGIDLQKYKQPLPLNHSERCKHLSLLSFAYKRIAHLPCIKLYISIT